ncbi:glycosyltransferase family 2 protein [bacterium]|nr:glycosyltransferase family 2 protein [bacterium]
MKSQIVSLSICIPAYNEEKSLRSTVEELIANLEDSYIDFEILIVDDGSTDSTFKIAKGLKRIYPEIKLFHHDKNAGIGVCFRTALANSTKEYFTWFPADGENSPGELINGVRFLNENLVVTSHHLGQDPRHLIRRIISRFYTLILNIKFNLRMKYYNGLTIFPASILKNLELRCKGFGIFAESIIKTLHSGCKIVELSYPLRGRGKGKSKVLTIKSGLRTFKELMYITIIMPVEN